MKHIESTRPKTRRPFLVVGSLVVITATLCVLAVIGFIKYRQIKAAMEAPPPPEMPVSVKLASAESVTFRRSTVVVGTVLASQSIRLRTELTGIVTDVLVKPGQMVKKGDVLIRFDVRTEEADLKYADANRKLALADYERSKKLAAANANSAQELDVAAAALTRSEADVERLRVMIEKKTLAAPFDAKVGLFDLHVGQYLSEGTEITMLEGVADYLLIDFAVPAHVADAIKVGDAVNVRLDLATDTAAKANIIAIDSQANAISRSLVARARLDNPPSTLQPNDSVRVSVFYGDTITGTAVPQTAIRRSPTGTMAYVAIEKDGQLRAQARPIILAGGGDGTSAWIAVGVKPGDQVVADGSFKVMEDVILVDLAGPQT